MPVIADDRRLHRPARTESAWERLRPYLAATAIIAVASAVAPVLQRLPHANNSLLFLTGVLITAVRYGVWPSIYASLLSFVVYNFLFTPPLYTFDVGEEGDLATLVFFLLMAAITGNLAARMREAGHKREIALRHIAALQEFTRNAAAAASCTDVLQALARHLADHFRSGCIAGIPAGDSGEAAVAVARPGTAGDELSVEAARARIQTGQWTRWPILTTRQSDAFAAVEAARPAPDEEAYASAVIEQAAVALDRILLVSELESVKLITEREQLRASLLSSVSHDLRTPLASILGAASSLKEYDCALGATDREALMSSVLDETHRLDRYIQNLLDMTRLAHGPLELHRDWEDLRDLIATAVRRLRLRDDIRIETTVDEDAQLVFVHGDLVEQALVNLLDNAARYTPAGGRIEVTARADAGYVDVEIADSGPGIPAADLERVFDPFYRVRERDRRSGTGLGLSICRGIAHAHGGDVMARVRPDGTGAILRFRLPATRPASGGRA
jgi:two-component system, OmpR family, sensor histidine kinase KdpD